MCKRTIFVRSIFAIGVLFSSVTGSADRFADVPSNERRVRVSAGPSAVNGLVGETVQLACTSAPPNNNVILRWARLDNAPLPRTAQQRAGSLTIRNAASSASGVYVCRAVSVLTNDIISHAFVTVNIAESHTNPLIPTLAIHPERKTVAQGSVAVIRCTSPTHPRAAVKWRKLNDEFSSHVEISNNEIRIPSAVVKDRGVYICEYENAAGAARVSSVLEIDRREPPVVEIYPKSQQKIEIGSSTFIQCRVLQGIPRPKIRWLRRGQRAFSPKVVKTGEVLRFTGVTHEDDGEYTCTAENAAGRVNAIAVLEVISRPVVTVSQTSPVRVKVGQRVRLECTATGKPTPHVSWHNGLTEDRTSTLGTAFWEITRAQLSDTGTYTCSAMNIAGRSEEQVQVIVDEYRPGIRPSPAPSSPPEEENVFGLHMDAYIRCSYSIPKASNKNVFYKWERDDGRAFSSRIAERHDTLLIHRVEREDSGRYRCVGVDTTTGFELLSKTFSLRVIAPPNVTVYPTHQLVRLGDDALITCTATGDEPVVFYWSTSNNEPLPRSAIVDRGALRFRGMKYADAGTYVCHARNHFGSGESSAEVRLDHRPRPAVMPVISAKDHFKTAIENSDVELECIVNGLTNADYNITWRRERSELPRTRLAIGNTLRLYRLQADDSDRYNCHLHSPYGASMDYIDLQVERFTESHKSPVDENRPPQTGTAERSYYRAFIILSTPYEATFADRTSAKYVEFSNDISEAVKYILADSNFVNATVVGITKTKDAKESKVLVDLEMTESEVQEEIKNLLDNHLTVEHKLNSVAAVPERLAVLDLSDRPTTCVANELSCDKGTHCYPIEGRCNNYTQCPDRSDELDCPGWNDVDVKYIEDKCRSDNKYFCPLGVYIICSDDRCDGKKDCFFGEDESLERCPSTSGGNWNTQN